MRYVLGVCLLWLSLYGIVHSVNVAIAADEREIVENIAAKYKAQSEVTLDDGSRCDMVSDTHAWEVDWAPKWAEGVGQSLHYSSLTGKRPGVVLLTRDPGGDWRVLVRGAYVCGKHGIDFRVEIVKEEG
jgi:hypothetical protein